jgi:hypothetical protein
VHDLDAAQNDTRTIKVFEPQHRSGSAFDRPMILLDYVVQILDLPNLDGCLALSIYRMERSQIGTAPIDGHRLGCAVLSDGFIEERRAAALSRLALNRKSMVLPALSTAR